MYNRRHYRITMHRRNMAGDGFLKDVFKAVKKIQPAKFLGKVANIASPILAALPVVGPAYKEALAIGKALSGGKGGWSGVDIGAGYIGGGSAQALSGSTTAASTAGGNMPGIPPSSGPAYGPGGPGTKVMKNYNAATGKFFGRRRSKPIDTAALRKAVTRLRRFERYAKSVMVVHNFKKVGHMRVGHARRAK